MQRAACRYNNLIILALIKRWNLRTSENVINSTINLQQNYSPFNVGTFLKADSVYMDSMIIVDTCIFH